MNSCITHPSPRSSLGLINPVVDRLVRLLRLPGPPLLVVPLAARHLVALEFVLAPLLSEPLHLMDLVAASGPQDLLGGISDNGVLAPGATARLYDEGILRLGRLGKMHREMLGDSQFFGEPEELGLVPEPAQEVPLDGNDLPARVPKLQLVLCYVLRRVVLRWEQPHGPCSRRHRTSALPVQRVVALAAAHHELSLPGNPWRHLKPLHARVRAPALDLLREPGGHLRGVGALLLALLVPAAGLDDGVVHPGLWNNLRLPHVLEHAVGRVPV